MDIKKYLLLMALLSTYCRVYASVKDGEFNLRAQIEASLQANQEEKEVAVSLICQNALSGMQGMKKNDKSRYINRLLREYERNRVGLGVEIDRTLRDKKDAFEAHGYNSQEYAQAQSANKEATMKRNIASHALQALIQLAEDNGVDWDPTLV